MPIEIFHSLVAVLFLTVWGVIGAMSTPHPQEGLATNGFTRPGKINQLDAGDL